MFPKSFLTYAAIARPYLLDADRFKNEKSHGCQTLTFKNNCFMCFNKSTLNMMKNAFHFILKVLAVLKIFKFLS